MGEKIRFEFEKAPRVDQLQVVRRIIQSEGIRPASLKSQVDEWDKDLFSLDKKLDYLARTATSDSGMRNAEKMRRTVEAMSMYLNMISYAISQLARLQASLEEDRKKLD